MRQTQAQKRASRADGLLEAALDLFSTKGYGNVSMQEIAQKSNMTYSLMYYYYKNKEELFHAATSYSINQAIENYDNLKERHDSPVDLINDWLDSNVIYARTLKRLVKIMIEFSDRREEAPSVTGEIAYLYEFERNLISESIRLGVDQGIFKCNNPEQIAGFVSRHIDGIFYNSIIHPNFDIASAMQELKTVIWTLLDTKAVASKEAKQGLKSGDRAGRHAKVKPTGLSRI